MREKFWSKTNIFGLAGILAYAVTTLVLFIPFKGEPSMSLVNWQSPLGIVVIILFASSIALYGHGMFKEESKLSYRDMQGLIERRKKYLPSLDTVIDKRLKRASELANRATQRTLVSYRDKYLLHSWKYVVCKAFWSRNDDLAIQNALAWTGFLKDNLFYGLLKDSDTQYQSLTTQYQNLVAQVIDGKLKKLLDGIWIEERTVYSMRIWCMLSKKSNKVPHTPFGIRFARRGESFGEQTLVRQRSKVTQRISELLEGDYDR